MHESFAALGERAYEIVVCDNNSTDRTAAIAHENGARVAFEPHNQIARARNTATAHSRGEWLIYLDADTSLNPSLLGATLRALATGQYCGGGSTIRFDRAQLAPAPAALLWLWNTISRTMNLAAGSYIFCLRQGCDDIRGFDETLYAAEELMFSHALKRWGRKRRLRFRIFDEAPIVTSARKMDWFGQWELLRHMLLLTFRPNSIRRRSSCDLWYKRPKDKT